MEYLFGIPTKVEENYIILETPSGEGRRIWTQPLDEYIPNRRTKIYTHSCLRLENNTVVNRTYGFLREEDSTLFSLLLQIKGIGPKTSLDIVSNSTGKIVKYILDDNLMALMSLPGLYKYAKEIIDFFRKPKNKILLNQLVPYDGDTKSTKRKEILEIIGEMGVDAERSRKILETIENYETLETGILIGKIMENIGYGK